MRREETAQVELGADVPPEVLVWSIAAVGGPGGSLAGEVLSGPLFDLRPADHLPLLLCWWSWFSRQLAQRSWRPG